jgi:hypothetical protein
VSRDPNLRAAVVRALEAYEDGDADYAVALLEAALDDRERSYPCPECRLRFEWPGLRDSHLAAVHGVYGAEAA